MENSKTYLGFCLMSKSAYNGKRHLKWCVREPDFWVFFSQEDTEEYLADKDNWIVCPFEKAIEIEPMLIGISRMPVGTDIQICKEGGFFCTKNRMWFADNATGEEVEISDEDVDFDSARFATWIREKK